MKWELYLPRRVWEEIKRAVRERATPVGEKKPRCENCSQLHGKLKRNAEGYFVPQWLHTAHVHGAPMESRDISDYLALCPSCHMAYDREPDADGYTPPYRKGYKATSTDELVRVVRGAGVDLREVDEHCWEWQIGDLCGVEETPVLAVGAVIARLSRLAGEYM